LKAEDAAPQDRLYGPQFDLQLPVILFQEVVTVTEFVMIEILSLERRFQLRLQAGLVLRQCLHLLVECPYRGVPGQKGLLDRRII
jgi:hypothetical protein